MTHLKATKWTFLWHLGLAMALLSCARAASAQTSRLTLTQALKLAIERAETLEIARAGEARADAEQLQVRSQRLPQINFAGAYNRTLASEFTNAFQTTSPSCAPLTVDPAHSMADRLSELERAASCGAITPSFGLDKLPFGQRNIYQATLLFSQSLYSGGRISAEADRAEASRRSAILVTTGTEAQLQLDVTRAF